MEHLQNVDEQTSPAILTQLSLALGEVMYNPPIRIPVKNLMEFLLESSTSPFHNFVNHMHAKVIQNRKVKFEIPQRIPICLK